MAEQREQIWSAAVIFPATGCVHGTIRVRGWQWWIWRRFFTGHRSITSQGNYEMFDAPIGVDLRVEAADKSEPFLTPEKEWETEEVAYPGCIWHEDGRLHMLYNVGETTCLAVSDGWLQLGATRCWD